MAAAYKLCFLKKEMLVREMRTKCILCFSLYIEEWVNSLRLCLQMKNTKTQSFLLSNFSASHSGSDTEKVNWPMFAEWGGGEKQAAVLVHMVSVGQTINSDLWIQRKLSVEKKIFLNECCTRGSQMNLVYF